ncbi:ribosomal RNA small subunit methyltransferase E [Sulfuriferula plumbiphila]|uniref:Ribosomal RNA small subunit methyltransferase E n=1 Tax=Sulfuriferula plumbiphila TaxID=171865 RepID=A0A512L676_9PROT|nr:16S rRNA (uracil(1498)-N(3))-methyltransferase [Sulfuriferula plumbiphila]BBP05901.1 ribosomal RNA small subunit methyltransferase E [Sulfuriferula plumbiphila]GEP29671.1 ribosomal RNA small subunit methyltransferase E [Sulfuriferula plumbiphila]
MPRFYLPDTLAPDTLITLPDACAHHAARVLRLTAGDAVTLFNGQGGEWAGNIHHIGKREVEVHVDARQDVERETPLRVTLAQGVSSGERMDYTLQKAVELGVHAIQPVACARSVVKLSGERADKRRNHWQNLVIAACEQCARNRVPEVSDIAPLPVWLAQSATAPLKLMFAPDAQHTLHTLPRPGGDVTMLAGPEGGFAADEYSAALTAGFIPIRLGPRVLRTETAALAALAAMQTLWGDL